MSVDADLETPVSPPTLPSYVEHQRAVVALVAGPDPSYKCWRPCASIAWCSVTFATPEAAVPFKRKVDEAIGHVIDSVIMLTRRVTVLTRDRAKLEDPVYQAEAARRLMHESVQERKLQLQELKELHSRTVSDASEVKTSAPSVLPPSEPRKQPKSSAARRRARYRKRQAAFASGGVGSSRALRGPESKRPVTRDKADTKRPVQLSQAIEQSEDDDWDQKHEEDPDGKHSQSEWELPSETSRPAGRAGYEKVIAEKDHGLWCPVVLPKKCRVLPTPTATFAVLHHIGQRVLPEPLVAFIGQFRSVEDEVAHVRDWVLGMSSSAPIRTVLSCECECLKPIHVASREMVHENIRPPTPTFLGQQALPAGARRQRSQREELDVVRRLTPEQ
jgi:hypothetical protein